MATLKPPTPLLAPHKETLKPASPLHPKNAPKTPISHPQRRRRFQSRLGQPPQRRRRFQSQTDTSEQRRHRFQESGPPGLQDPYAIPVAGGGAWPGDQWAADVTNVVKPTRFKSPREDLCYKRRQSEPKNQHFTEKADGLTTFVTTGQKSTRKTPWIDDVCNNTRRATRQRTRRRRCGGRRRDRRARAGFEATRRAKLAARTTRGRAAAHRHTQRPGPPAHGTPVAPDNGYDSETSPRGSRKDRPR